MFKLFGQKSGLIRIVATCASGSGGVLQEAQLNKLLGIPPNLGISNPEIIQISNF